MRTNSTHCSQDALWKCLAVLLAFCLLAVLKESSGWKFHLYKADRGNTHQRTGTHANTCKQSGWKLLTRNGTFLCRGCLIFFYNVPFVMVVLECFLLLC